MKAELRQCGRDLWGLFPGELNPDPLPDDLGEFEKVRGLIPEQSQQFMGGELAVAMPEREIQSGQFAVGLAARAHLFGSALESLIFESVSFHGLFFVLCCSASVCRPSP
jgi:hypothetical protein